MMITRGDEDINYCYGQIRDSPRSLFEQRFPKIQVTGHQKLLGAPVMFSLSWLQSVSWEFKWGGCMCQGGDAISWVSVFSVWGENLVCVFEMYFFWPVSILFVSPRSVTPTWPLVFRSTVLCWPLVGGCGFYFHCSFEIPKDQFTLTLLWFVQCFVRFPPCDPCPSGFVFWGKATIS